MLVLPISLTFAAALAVINLWLAIRVGQHRVGQKVMHGDGGVPVIQKRMRAHSNFAEYVPIVLVLVVLLELAWGQPMWLWVVAALYVVGRILHALGMDAEQGSPLRMIGFAISALTMLGLAFAALMAVYSSGARADAAPKTFGTHEVPATAPAR